MSMPDYKIAAEQVLEEFWDGNGFPVNPIMIAQSMGIKVHGMNLPDDVSGALMKERGSSPEIFVSKTDSKNRIRFSIAHELGHYVRRLLDEEKVPDEYENEEYEYIDLRDGNSKSGNDPEEIFANNFAANLLMPSNELKRQKGKSVYQLMNLFGVSGEAIRYRLRKERMPIITIAG